MDPTRAFKAMAKLVEHQSVSLAGLVVTITIALIALRIVRVSTKRCPGIPSIPFHISVRDAYNRTSEIRFHNTRLRPVLKTHGAVNLWNSGQWVVLVTKPEYVVQILRNERVVAKGGFYGKVPHSTLAGLFGENIIDSHGEVWKGFTSIMKPGIQRGVDISSLKKAAKRLNAVFAREQQNASPAAQGVVVNDIIERWAIDVFGEDFFDVDFHALDGGSVRSRDALTGVLWTLGGHLILLFPLFERIGWPMYPTRSKCFAMIKELEEALLDVTKDLEYAPGKPDRSEKLIYRLKRARDTGAMSDFHYRVNLKMMFFAGHENVKFAFVAVLWELSQHPDMQERLYREIVAHEASSDDDDLKSLPYLTAILSETLRLYPPVSQLINRKTLEPVSLGDGITIPKGTWVGWTAYGIHTDPNTWGPSDTSSSLADGATMCMLFRSRLPSTRCAAVIFRLMRGRGVALDLSLRWLS